MLVYVFHSTILQILGHSVFISIAHRDMNTIDYLLNVNINVSYITRPLLTLILVGVKEKSHSRCYKHAMGVKMSKYVYGQWCVVLGLLLLMYGLHLIHSHQYVGQFCVDAFTSWSDTMRKPFK